MSKTHSKTANVEDNKKVLYWAIAYGYDELYILTRKDLDKYLNIYDAMAGWDGSLTWNDYKKLLNDDDGFNKLYNAWLDELESRYTVENFRELVKKIHKGIDVSGEKGYKEIEWEPIRLDSPMPPWDSFLGFNLEDLIANNPGYFLYNSLPHDIFEEYLVEETEGAPGHATYQAYLDCEKKDEILEKLKSRGYKLIETSELPF